MFFVHRLSIYGSSRAVKALLKLCCSASYVNHCHLQYTILFKYITYISFDLFTLCRVLASSPRAAMPRTRSAAHTPFILRPKKLQTPKVQSRLTSWNSYRTKLWMSQVALRNPTAPSEVRPWVYIHIRGDSKKYKNISHLELRQIV